MEKLDDFGFTEPIIITHTSNEEELKKRLLEIRKVYIPFLKNLLKNADDPMIKWPNRKGILEKQIKLLTRLTEV